MYPCVADCSMLRAMLRISTFARFSDHCNRVGQDDFLSRSAYEIKYITYVPIIDLKMSEVFN